MPKVGTKVHAKQTSNSQPENEDTTQAFHIDSLNLDESTQSETEIQELRTGQLLPGVVLPEFAELGSGRSLDLETGSREIVGDRDDRTKVTDTSLYPYSAICLIVSPVSGNRVSIGTGFLVGPKTVITAGHVVYSRELSRYFSKFDVYFACNGDLSGARARSSARIVATTKEYQQSGDARFDFAVLQLKDSIQGYPLYPVVKDAAELSTMWVNVVGYPGDKVDLSRNNATMWQGAGGMLPVGNSDRQLRYTADSKGGNSGGPLIYVDNKSEAYVVGIHNYAGNSDPSRPGRVLFNTSTRMTADVLAQINKWISEA